MIQEKELRIGNWVLFHGEFSQVESIGTYGCSFKNGFAKYTLPNLKPIPLTEEMFLKVSPISKQEGYPYKFLKGYLKMRNGVFFYKYYGIEVELPYLHQLQNIYFELTGEELKIEL